MNYYIDFDNTLYNTPLLTEKMLKALSETIVKLKLFDYDEILKECKFMFNREHIYDIFKLCDFFSQKYNIDDFSLTSSITQTILDGENLLFNDTIPFLQKLKDAGHNLFLLTNCYDNPKYQILKISGSNLVHFFDGIFASTLPKYELDINYANGIFIDDRVEDLIGLYSKKPKQLIRLRRKENKYSNKETNISDILEYETLDSVPIF